MYIEILKMYMFVIILKTMAKENHSEGSKFKALGARYQSLGAGAKTAGSAFVLVVLLFTAFTFFANYHAIYLKTGTPMLKYGIAMTFFQPFYSMWATWQLTQKYALGR